MRLVGAGVDVVIASRVDVIRGGAGANTAGIDSDIDIVEVGRVDVGIFLTAYFASSASCNSLRLQVTPNLPPGEVLTTATAASNQFTVRIIPTLLPPREIAGRSETFRHVSC